MLRRYFAIRIFVMLDIVGLSYADIQLIQALGLNPGQTLHELQTDALMLAFTQFSDKLKSVSVPAPHP